MTEFISQLTSGDNALTSSNLWGEVGNAAPLIGGLAIFAFGLYIVRRVIRKGSHGKAGV